MASEHFLNGLETSEDSPYYNEIMKYKELIRDNIVFLRRETFSGYFYIAFLPEGDIGYNNHEYKVIKDLEDVKGALNEILSQKNKE